MSPMPLILPSRCRQRGATLVEWLIVAPPMLFIILAIIQVGFIMMAKTSVNYAVFEAARAGSVNHADINTIDAAFANALVPFYGGGKTAPQLAASLVNASADLAVSGTAITILNPTQESFMDFGVVENGITQIPNDNLRYRATTPDVKGPAAPPLEPGPGTTPSRAAGCGVVACEKRAAGSADALLESVHQSFSDARNFATSSSNCCGHHKSLTKP